MTPSSVVPDLSFLLLDKITAGFSPDRLIGIGGFGKVYKGVHNNGEEIAVKVLHDMIGLDDKNFMNEFKNLQMLQHPNIVRLVGCCNETRKKYVHYEGRLVLAEEIKRALCFEYLRNGSLDRYLSDEYSGQDWKTRYAIIKGICLGLKYLHEDLEASIYHLDLKPANILLGENMEPKIADFGLSRLFGEEKTRITKSQIGTFGYLPPEYIDRNIISNKLDVFSLGVIVIKIITGRDGYNKSDQMPPQDFIRLVQTNWKNRLHKPTDSIQIERCMEIALSCVEFERCNRPTIGEIVHKLSKMETMIAKLSPQLPHLLRNNLVPHKKEENDPEASMEIKQRHLQDNLDSFIDFDDNVDSFLSNDGDGREIFAALKKGPSEQESLKSLSLSEIGSSRTSNNKVVCCHFSTDGKLLASAGREKKVFLWNMDNFNMDTKAEEHTNFITDVRFRPNSTQLATSSSDGTVRLWNAVERNGTLQTFHGHTSHVTSVDFHPKMTDVLCSCDDNGELRFWTVGQSAPSRISRVKWGGTGRVRFQPRSGQLLAVAARNMVNIIDIDKDASLHSAPKLHSSEVKCICWDESGEYLASASQDSVKVWSAASGACVYELRSDGNQYESCVFHPRHPKVLIVGGYQTMELWSISDNQRNVVAVHKGVIAALAHSTATGPVASASHDRSVKLWK